MEFFIHQSDRLMAEAGATFQTALQEQHATRSRFGRFILYQVVLGNW
ncbi:MAG: hypothetical protein N2235_15550 [Fischerella sp.]|nr:hypothetical protein [Fischerella sp.]